MTVIDTYDVSLRASNTALEAAQHEAAISKEKCAEKDNKIIEMEKKMAVLHDNNEQQADKIEIQQRKGIHETTQLLLLCVKHAKLGKIVVIINFYIRLHMLSKLMCALVFINSSIFYFVVAR